MRLHFRSVVLSLALTGILPAQNAIVQNAASAQATAYVGSSSSLNGLQPVTEILAGITSTPNIVSPGMLAILYYSYSGIGYSDLSVSLPSAPLSPATVYIRPSGTTTPILLKPVSFAAGSVTFVVPRDTPLGGAEIEYKTEGQPTAWTTVNVVPSSFAFFRTASGGPAIAQSVAANGSRSPIGLTTPAQPGQTILVTGSGLGTNPSVSVTVGGVPATVVSAQPHRANPGIDEVLFQMPSSASDGCYVPLVLTYGQGATVTSTISRTSNGLPCVHPFQLSVADMKTLDNGGYLAAGEIDMSTTLDVATAAAVSRNEKRGCRAVGDDGSGDCLLVHAGHPGLHHDGFRLWPGG